MTSEEDILGMTIDFISFEIMTTKRLATQPKHQFICIIFCRVLQLWKLWDPKTYNESNLKVLSYPEAEENGARKQF